MEINRKEIARYLGFRGTAPDSVSAQLIEDCIGELQETAIPKHCYQIFPAEILPPNIIRTAGMELRSHSLLANLKGCEAVYLFAATLGIGVDILIRRTEIREITKGAVMQAAAASMIEAYCNEIQEKIREESGAKGLYLRPRFSPGYGDLPLETQRTFIKILKTERSIGLTLTESCLMAPIKSVTAFIGLSPNPLHCHKQGCEVCKKLDCAFRLS